MLVKKNRWGIILGYFVVHLIVLSSCSGEPLENAFIRTPSMLAPQGPVAARIARPLG